MADSFASLFDEARFAVGFLATDFFAVADVFRPADDDVVERPDDDAERPVVDERLDDDLPDADPERPDDDDDDERPPADERLDDDLPDADPERPVAERPDDARPDDDLADVERLAEVLFFAAVERFAAPVEPVPLRLAVVDFRAVVDFFAVVAFFAVVDFLAAPELLFLAAVDFFADVDFFAAPLLFFAVDFLAEAAFFAVAITYSLIKLQKAPRRCERLGDSPPGGLLRRLRAATVAPVR